MWLDIGLRAEEEDSETTKSVVCDLMPFAVLSAARVT